MTEVEYGAIINGEWGPRFKERKMKEVEYANLRAITLAERAEPDFAEALRNECHRSWRLPLQLSRGENMTGPLTNAIYWASKSPTILSMVKAIQASVQATQSNMDAYGIAEAVGQTLVTAGKTDQANLIDVPIMVWGWDPVGVMTLRQQLGYTWVPSALQPPTEIIPGLMAAGTNSSAPVSPGPMYIKVSIDAADYPVYP